MANLRTLPLLFFTAMLVTGSFYNPGQISNEIEPDQVNGGTINGVHYTNETVNFQESGNFSIQASGTVSEFSNITTSDTREVDLFTSIIPETFIFKLEVREQTPTMNITSEQFHTEDSLNQTISFIINDLPLIFNATDYNDGFAQMNLRVTDNATVRDAIFISTDGDYLGTVPTNASLWEYNMNYANGTITQISFYAYLGVIIFNVTKETHLLDVTRTQVSSAYMGYFNRYSNAYNVSASAYQVSITDGENFGVHISMFDRIEANYTETFLNVVSYAFVAYDVTELKFQNGSTVDWGMYPRDMLPIVVEAQGTFVEAGFSHVNSKLISTFQNVVAAFAQVDVNATDTSLDIEARLAVWGLQSSTTMVAFRDGNKNGRLDVGLNEDGLYVDRTDRVEFLGLGEAYQTTIVNGKYKSHQSNSSITFAGLGIQINNTNANETTWNVDVVHEGFGPVNAPTSQSTFFNEPFVEADGDIIFEFGATYNNFPVTWVNMTDPRNSFVELTDIGYSYVVRVNPTHGFATISPTWTLEGLRNRKNAMRGLSLSLAVTSEFFALRASYSASATNETIENSRTKTFGRIAVGTDFGDAAEVDVTGPKQFYLLNGTDTHQANFDVINLVTIAGSFEGERVTPFSSESDNTAGTARVGGFVETLGVDFFFTANLIFVSYPQWGGDSIVHDPDYSVNYTPNQPQQTSSETPSDTSSSDTASESSSSETDTGMETTSTPPQTTTTPTTTQDDDGDSAGGGIPGFTFISGIGLMVSVIVLRRKRD